MSVAVTTSPIIVVQRQTVEWEKLSDVQFHQQSQIFCDLWGKPRDYIWQLFCLWNQTFTVDYRVVRQKLKTLSLDNIQRAKNILFIPYRDYLNIPEQSGYYLFMDDDDWIDPEIFSHFHQHLDILDKLPELLLWRSANIGSPNQEHVVFVWGMNGRCMTNNYAVHSAWLQPFSKIQDVLQHKDATAIFEKQHAVPHLDCVLTVSNKSPISSVSLDRGLQGDPGSARLVALVENYLQRMSLVQDGELSYMPWAQEYISGSIDIFDQVLRSRR